MRREIYLDLDGVCADLNRAAILAHGLDPQTVFMRWAARHRGEFQLYRVLGMEKNAFWDDISGLGEAFWIGIEQYRWFPKLYEELAKHGHVVFCSSANRSPACLSGKLRWLQDRFGHRFKDYIFTWHKDRLAHSSAWLIDDFDMNVDKFAARGGNAILFPQVWNSNHERRDDPLSFVLDGFD